MIEKIFNSITLKLPLTPPETGASLKRIDFSAQRLAILFEAWMSIVLQSIQSEELLIVDKSPFLEVKTSSTFRNNFSESNS